MSLLFKGYHTCNKDDENYIVTPKVKEDVWSGFLCIWGITNNKKILLGSTQRDTWIIDWMYGTTITNDKKKKKKLWIYNIMEILFFLPEF